MIILKIILYPFSLIYGLITWFRNLLYDLKLFKIHKIDDVFVINVGNLSVGGTGKTPHVEYLVRLLSSKKKAILSRGYGRKSEGLIMADETSTPVIIGDEPYQYYSKFKDDTIVCVAESRVEGARKIKNVNPAVDTIILDDAFQHRGIDRDLNLLVTDFINPFYADFMMPSGRLREFRFGAERADAIVVSKCPNDLSVNQQEKIKLAIANYSEAPVFFSKIKYVDIEPNIGKCVLVTGIAISKPLKAHLRSKNVEIIEHYDYPDHYAYKQSDIDKVSDDVVIITTEKDFVKINALDIKGKTIIEISIEVEFFGKEFDDFLFYEMNRN